jgi:hypothetical protein
MDTIRSTSARYGFGHGIVSPSLHYTMKEPYTLTCDFLDRHIVRALKATSRSPSI